MRQITLLEACTLMKKINQSEDWNCYFENGHIIIESKAIVIKEVENGTD